MLVIISDLHLTDGSTGLRIPAGAFRVLRSRLEDMAYDASKRDENTYQPIESFDLVLLGDIFDLLRTAQWNNQAKGQIGFARPWSNPQDPALLQKVNDIVDGILQNNTEACDILQRMAAGTAISLPPATKIHQVDRRVSHDSRSKRRVPVTVNIHYMCGNHDWIFHLPGAGYDAIRQKVIHNLGLKNAASPFPHEAVESVALQAIFAQHSVFARHGDIYDAFNYVKAKGRNYASLGDALVVEMFNPIPQLIAAELGHQLPPQFFAELAEMGSIRPSLMTPVWIASLLERYQLSPQQRGIINEIWQTLLSNFLKLDFLSELDQRGFDLVDKLELAFQGLKRLSLDQLDELASFADKITDLYAAIGGGESGFDKNAAKEEAYQAQEARFIVFGHSHHFKVMPLRRTLKNEKPFDQIYINSGTWHPLHEIGHDDPKQRGFIIYKTMSYLSFYRQDERKGRAYETWTGTLDL